MDKLDTAIEAKRKQLADLQRQLEVATIELRALEEAAKLRPVSLGFTATPVATGQHRDMSDDEHASLHCLAEPKRGGRERGCISKKWRAALQDVAKQGNSYRTTDEIFLVVSKRVRATLPAIRERVRVYCASGLMEENNGRYRVSQHAIEKFDLDLASYEKGPAIETGPSLLNGHGALV